LRIGQRPRDLGSDGHIEAGKRLFQPTQSNIQTIIGAGILNYAGEYAITKKEVSRACRKSSFETCDVHIGLVSLPPVTAIFTVPLCVLLTTASVGTIRDGSAGEAQATSIREVSSKTMQLMLKLDCSFMSANCLKSRLQKQALSVASIRAQICFSDVSHSAEAIGATLPRLADFRFRRRRGYLRVGD
jgi:hypothetical protein